MAHYHMTTVAVAATVEHIQHHHHRILQNFNSTPDNDREAGFISVGFLLAVILLGVSMFICNVVASKCCPGMGAQANGDTNGEHINDGVALPYSSEIRQAYLAEALKSHEFCSSVAVAVSSNDIEVGNGSEKGESAVDVDTTTREIEGDALSQCLICFDTFADGDAVTTHCTNKSYHRHCIMEWLLKHDNCPYCRRPFFLLLPATSNADIDPTVPISNAATASTANSTAIIGTTIR